MKKVLGDYDLPSEGDIIDQVAAGAEKMRRLKDEVAQLKERTDFVSLLTWLGLEGKENGKGRMYLCPFHDDKNPSLSVDRNKGVWHCFGCGKGGDMVSFIEEYRNVDFKGALAVLRDFHGILPANTAKAYKRREPPKERVTITPVDEPEQAAAKADQQPSGDPGQLPAVTLDEACEYYHKRLYKSPSALAYLERRGLGDPELIARFKIGFADGSLTGILSQGQKQAFSELGIFRENGMEHFFNCVTFPVFDEAERCVGLYGRMTDPEVKIKHLYLKGEHRGIFNRKASRVYDEIILTEGIIDALSLVKLGFQNVQALYGINGFTAEHLSALKNDRVKTVILGFDNDEAGKKGTVTRKADLLSEGLGVKTITPQGKDWNEDLSAGVSHETIRDKIETAERFEKKAREPEYSVNREGIVDCFKMGKITYRVAGGKELFVTNLKVNVKVEYEGESTYDNLDLLSARSRSGFCQNMCQLFSLELNRMEKDLLRILEHYEAEREKKMAELSGITGIKELTEEEKELGMKFLSSPAMFDQIVDDMERLGYVGEDLNKKLLYIAASSRKLDDPISVIIVSQSASGKSFLVDTVKRLMPEEDVIAVTSLSDQALNYLPEEGLLHKFLILGEAVHSDVIEHQIREMLSGKFLSRMVPIKDEKTGKITSRTIHKDVLVSAVMSSTSGEINPENASRCFVVNVDETREQTERIYSLQRNKNTVKRLLEKKHSVPQIVRKHHAAQRLLKTRTIVNNYGHLLKFPSVLLRMRRDHDRFVDLLVAVCFLRQFQKEIKTVSDPVSGESLEYIECDLADYRIASEILVKGVLASTYSDLPKSLVRFYEEVREIFRQAAAERGVKILEAGLSQREIRKHMTWLGAPTIKLYLRKLLWLEYLSLGRGGVRGMRNFYRLTADEGIESMDVSMIPAPEELEKLINQESEKVGKT